MATTPPKKTVKKKEAEAPPAPAAAAHHESSPDRIIAWVVGGVTLMVLTFLATWLILKPPASSVVAAPVFSKIGPVSAEVQGYTFRATLVLESQGTDPIWFKKNEGAIQTYLGIVLADLDKSLMGTTNREKLERLQNAVRDALNKKFPDAKIKGVLVTDFLSVTN